jgi:hypothetical protein
MRSRESLKYLARALLGLVLLRTFLRTPRLGNGNLPEQLISLSWSESFQKPLELTQLEIARRRRRCGGPGRRGAGRR